MDTDIVADTKVCKGCNKTKPSSEFRPSPSCRNGISPWCKKCARRRDREYYAANKEKMRARTRRYNAANRGKRRAYWHAHGKLARFQRHCDLHGKTLEAQGGVCAICGRTPEENGERLCVDHDHETGEIRGLLCRRCNLGIGYFQDDPVVLRQAATYVEKI